MHFMTGKYKKYGMSALTHTHAVHMRAPAPRMITHAFFSTARWSMFFGVSTNSCPQADPTALLEDAQKWSVTPCSAHVSGEGQAGWR